MLSTFIKQRMAWCWIKLTVALLERVWADGNCEDFTGFMKRYSDILQKSGS